MKELRLEAFNSHLYPGHRGRIFGPLPSAAESEASACQVAFSDGSVALGVLLVGDGTEGVLETDPYTTAAGTKIPAKTWRLELSLGDEGNRSFRVRENLRSA